MNLSIQVLLLIVSIHVSLLKIFKHYNQFPYLLKKLFVYGVASSLLALIHLNSFTNISDDLGFISSTITLPIILPLLFHYYFRKKTIEIERGLLAVTTFFILSSIPFLLGILEQREGADVLWKYGLKEGKEVFIGFYGNVANSSKIIAVSLLVIFSFFLRNKRNIYFSLLVLIGSYALIYTFARTGWFTFLGGLFLLYVGGRKISEILTKVVPVILIAILFLGYVVSSNEFIERKISGNKIYNEKKEVSLIESYENSRLGIQGAGIEIIENMTTSELIFGVGLNELKKRMKKYFGSALVPHNKVLMIIIGGGLKMLIMFIFYVIYLFRFIRQYSSIKSKDYFIKLPIIVFGIFIITQIPSHGFDFYASILFSFLIMYSVKIHQQKNHLILQ